MILRTPDEVANARRNVLRYQWSKAELQRVVERARPWLERTDEELWSMVTGQAVPRGIHVNPDLGCPRCGRDVYRSGNYPWIISPDRPWKLECPSCGEVWPRNDFGTFHRSGLGPGGVFDPDRADRSLLVGPDGEGVDDGLGWVDGDGNRWWFIAYYSHYGIWTWLPEAALDLATAWLYTGDAAYAHKALVILDRVADVYPDMDLAPYSAMDLYNSHGGTGRGRIQGCIWETRVAETMARAWDMVCDTLESDSDLVGFLSRKAGEWDIPNTKRSPALIRENVENGLLREFIRSCHDLRISGNEGMTQTTMAVAAAVLDDPVETPAALDWLFESGSRSGGGGGHIPGVLVGEVDRDGVGNEASPNYSFIWMNLFNRCAAVLERCGKHRDYDLHRDFPRLRRMYAAPYRLTVLDRYTPHIGDTGKTGDPGMASVDLELILEAFTRFDDPVFARVAYRLNGDTCGGLHTSVFDPEPEAIQDEIRGVIEREGGIDPGSKNLNGYGLAILRTGRGDRRRAAWLYYGRSTGHGHRDRLNFGLYFRGMDVLPEMGYPEYADGKWPKRAGWTRNTVSHNTVVVDEKGQREDWIGHCTLFAASPGVGAVEVASPAVYPGILDYRRTLAMVDLDETDSYLVDFFRVDGGEDHVLSFHAGEGSVTTSTSDWDEQPEGTYAGESIPPGEHYDGAPDGKYRGSGFSYLTGVRKARQTDGGWWVDWDLKDTWATRVGDEAGNEGVHLRYHILCGVDEAALAWGEPPRNKPGNPAKIRYALLRNERKRSLFVSVIEPYSGGACLDEVERIDLDLAADDIAAAAVRVRSRQGYTDLILSSTDPDRLHDLGGGVRAAARFAVIRTSDSGDRRILAVGGTRVETPGGVLTIDRAAYAGVVRDFSRDDVGGAWIDVEADLPAGDRLLGAQLRVHNDGERDACYQVQSVSDVGSGIRRIDLGDTTFVRGLADTGEYRYNINPGEGFDVQTLVHVAVGAHGAQEFGATVDWSFR